MEIAVVSLQRWCAKCIYRGNCWNISIQNSFENHIRIDWMRPKKKKNEEAENQLGFACIKYEQETIENALFV